MLLLMKVRGLILVKYHLFSMIWLMLYPRSTFSGTAEEEVSGTGTHKTTSVEEAGVSFTPKTVSVTATTKDMQEQQTQGSYRLKITGSQFHRIHFGRVGDVFSRLMKVLNGKRLWILLDEWSVIPLELQPYLADLIRRSLFPVQGITVKIGAIEKRSKFQQTLEAGDYRGIRTRWRCISRFEHGRLHGVR